MTGEIEDIRNDIAEQRQELLDFRKQAEDVINRHDKIEDAFSAVAPDRYKSEIETDTRGGFEEITITIKFYMNGVPELVTEEVTNKFWDFSEMKTSASNSYEYRAKFVHKISANE